MHLCQEARRDRMQPASGCDITLIYLIQASDIDVRQKPVIRLLNAVKTLSKPVEQSMRIKIRLPRKSHADEP
jgi:hypothetical protein